MALLNGKISEPTHTIGAVDYIKVTHTRYTYDDAYKQKKIYKYTNDI